MQYDNIILGEKTNAKSFFRKGTYSEKKASET